MADEGHVIRGINWRETFKFTHLFRAFRIAIHPSKVILALLALITLYIGGRLLDTVWQAEHLAVPGEVVAYQAYQARQMSSGEWSDFNGYRAERRREIENAYADRLLSAGIVTNRDEAIAAARNGDKFDDLEKRIVDHRNQRYVDADKARDNAITAANALTDAAARERAIERAEAASSQAHRAAHNAALEDLREISAINGRGIFMEFFEYEVRQVDNVVSSVLSWNWLGGVWGREGTPGVLRSILNFFIVGPVWLMKVHTLYFILFTLLFLLVWAVFGGAISRIAAVHVAREEKISVRQALRFSIGKLLSFLFAPIIPLLIVLAVGLTVSLVALLGNIPYVGPILIGIAFVLALAAGFIMALVLLGTAGGFNLMYPTIAVEGSDSFDAISRSFSYVYARPWRMLFYTLIAVVYGALTYLFVRLFVWLMLVLTHHFVDLGMFRLADSHYEEWESMWPEPTSLFNLTPNIDFLGLNWGGDVGAFFVAFWVFLTIGLVGAFAISFYFSANTIIYYLMRHEVDATELDDVYLEQADEEFTETPPAPTTEPAAAPASPSTSTPSSEPPPSTPSPETPTPPEPPPTGT